MIYLQTQRRIKDFAQGEGNFATGHFFSTLGGGEVTDSRTTSILFILSLKWAFLGGLDNRKVFNFNPPPSTRQVLEGGFFLHPHP